MQTSGCYDTYSLAYAALVGVRLPLQIVASLVLLDLAIVYLLLLLLQLLFHLQQHSPANEVELFFAGSPMQLTKPNQSVYPVEVAFSFVWFEQNREIVSLVGWLVCLFWVILGWLVFVFVVVDKRAKLSVMQDEK